MKLKIDDDVDVNVKHSHHFHKEDVEAIVDKFTESVLVIIAASTVSHFLRKLAK
jgi:hypothetical protein